MKKNSALNPLNYVRVLLLATTLLIMSPVTAKAADSTDDASQYGFKHSMVTITFINGYRTQLTKAEPLLAKYHIPATYYVATDQTESSRGTNYLTVNDLQTLSNQGYQLGNTTESSEPIGTNNSQPLVTDDHAFQRFNDTQTWFQENIGVTPRTCAYPSGAYSQIAMKTAANPRLNFLGCVSGNKGIDIKAYFNPWRVNTVVIDRNISAQMLEDLINNVSASHTWANLEVVQMDDDHDSDQPYTTSSIFDWALHIASLRRDDGSIVITDVAGALKRIQREVPPTTGNSN